MMAGGVGVGVGVGVDEGGSGVMGCVGSTGLMGVGGEGGEGGTMTAASLVKTSGRGNKASLGDER